MVHTPRTLPPPPQLVKYSKKWTVRFQAVLNANPPRDWATAHAKKVLRAALRELARGKCVFCESALEVTTYMEIEHYVAKTVNSDLAFEWTNLLPACRLCNNAKGEQDHKGALLKPDDEDPEPYFWIHPVLASSNPTPGSTKRSRTGPTRPSGFATCSAQRFAPSAWTCCPGSSPGFDR